MISAESRLVDSVKIRYCGRMEKSFSKRFAMNGVLPIAWSARSFDTLIKLVKCTKGIEAYPNKGRSEKHPISLRFRWM